jgi:hypothetical protein
MLLWSSLTVHKSLETTDPSRSRRSFTGHYVPASHEFVWFKEVRRPTATRTVNGVEVVLHGDQTALGVQLSNRLRIRFPRTARALRRIRRVLG